MKCEIPGFYIAICRLEPMNDMSITPAFICTVLQVCDDLCATAAQARIVVQHEASCTNAYATCTSTKYRSN